MNAPPRDVRITDSTLRDGSHAMRHQFTEEQVRAVVSALDGAGVAVIEVSHGDGLGGSSFNYGFLLEDEIDLVHAAVDEATRARIAVLLLPGVGTVEDLRAAHSAGASVARIARTSSVRSMPTGHHVMHRPQPTQPDVPNWSIHVASLWVIHWRYRDRAEGLTCPPCTYEWSRVKHESHFRQRSACSPVRSAVSSTVLQKQVGQTMVQFAQVRQRAAT